MSAADRMAVRMPGGKIRSVPRRVGLAMVARSQATHAPAQSAPRPDAKGRRPVVQTVVATDGPVTVTAEYDGNVVRITDTLSQTPGQIAETMRTGSLPGGPAHSPELASEGTDGVPCTCPDDVTAQTSGVVDLADHEAAGSPVEFEEDDPPAAPVAFAVAPKGNASRDVWAKYAGFRGVTVTDEMGRNDIRDLVAELESDRMSRPAHEGGRPATPEDEPVTEDMVTRDDPGERTT